MKLAQMPTQDINLSTVARKHNSEDVAVENLFKTEAEIIKEEPPREAKYKRGYFDTIRDYLTPIVNGIAIAGNTLSAFGIASKSFPDKLNKFLDEKSEWFSKYVVPLSFASNVIEALSQQRLIEASLRFIPAISFWALPMFNFSYPMGLFSGSNTILSMAHKRLGHKLPNNDFVKNTKEILNTLKSIFNDFTKGKTNKEETNFIISSLTVLAGSIGGMLFGSQDRDTPLAKIMGSARSIAGVAVDIGLFLRNSIHEKVVGLSCGTASLLNLALRWIPDANIARAVNHLALAADDFGQTYWAQESRRRNRKETKSLRSNEMQALAA